MTINELVTIIQANGFPNNIWETAENFLHVNADYFPQVALQDLADAVQDVGNSIITPAAKRLFGDSVVVANLQDEQRLALGATLSKNEAEAILYTMRSVRDKYDYFCGVVLKPSETQPNNLFAGKLILVPNKTVKNIIVDFSVPDATIAPAPVVLSANANGEYVIPEGFLPSLTTADGKSISFYDNAECTGTPLSVGSVLVVNGGGE